MYVPSLILAAIGSVAELNALSHQTFVDAEPFSLTGTVSSVLFNGHYVLEDSSGRAHVRGEPAMSIEAGDRVVFSGYTCVDIFRQEQAQATNAVVLGHGFPPPQRTESVASIAQGEANFARVEVEGTVTGCFADDIDPNWCYLVLASEGNSTYVSVPGSPSELRQAEDLSRARISVRGTVIPGHCGARRVIGPHVETSGLDDFRILNPPALTNPTTFCALDRLTPSEVVRLGPQPLEGRVVARWRDRHLLLLDDADGVHRIDLRPDARLPDVGSRVRVIGLPETDLYRINLSKARCETLARPATPMVDEPVDDEALAASPGVRHGYFHGRIVRVSGRIVAEPNARSDWRAILETDERERLAVDISSLPDEAGSLAAGNVVSLTGCGLIETDNWRPGSPFPLQQGLVIVLRAPTDIQIVSRPPWWTTRWILAVIGTLAGLLVAVFIWNRLLNRLAERRGRQLYREAIARAASEFRVAERTRLAAEMHDSLSQALTGISCQIDAMEGARVKRPERLAHHLGLARRMLDGCRMQLRNCLWDLRNDILNNPDSASAIRETVLPHIGSAGLAVNFPISRSTFTDTTFHEILCILRELVANAVRHGKAANVAIAARRTDGRIVMTVTDDGAGFDPANRPGSGEGHFGLLGISERLAKLGGSLEISSSPGHGATATVNLDTNRENEQ